MALMVYMMVLAGPEHNHAHPSLVPGLSLLNLAFFLLCTPVQVSIALAAGGSQSHQLVMPDAP